MNNDYARMIASPAVRHRARALSLDLMSVQGTGPGGRIILRDLAAARPQPPNAMAADHLPPHLRRRAPQPMQFHAAVRAPLIITVECDVQALLRMRDQFNDAAPKSADGVHAQHVTLNDCFVKAMALAARARTGKSVTVGIALGSASAPAVVADACTLVMPQLSRAIRAARLMTDADSDHNDGDHADVLIANFGVFGARDAEFPASQRYPIVLSLGAAHQVPVARHGELAIATIMYATLCVGEGVLDAATAGTMLAAFRSLVENPASLFA